LSAWFSKQGKAGGIHDEAFLTKLFRLFSLVEHVDLAWMLKRF